MRSLCRLLTCTLVFNTLIGCGGSVPFQDPPPSPESEMKVNFKTSDPVRGARLYATTSNAKLLICADCHSDDPIVNNFGNIWSGRNSVDLIERAIYANTGGMGYLRNLLTYDDLVDIAAYLGNSPSSLSFDDTNLGAMSPEKNITLSSSIKTGVDQLNLQTIGPFKLGQTTCGNAIPRFDACKVGLVFVPKTKGDFEGSLIIRHANSPVPIEIKLKAKGI
jgi:hypothetical protein